jgi:hypothetical protein
MSTLYPAFTALHQRILIPMFTVQHPEPLSGTADDDAIGNRFRSAYAGEDPGAARSNIQALRRQLFADSSKLSIPAKNSLFLKRFSLFLLFSIAFPRVDRIAQKRPISGPNIAPPPASGYANPPDSLYFSLL